jgi:Fe2+ or Zn2+ uptake regulation protein
MAAALPRTRAQRRHTECVLRALETAGRATVQELHRRLRDSGDPVGLSTVYRELHRLVDVGCVREVVLPGEAVYLLPGGDLLVCDVCGRIEEAPRRRRTTAREEIEFFARTDPITLHGRCVRCGG